MNIHSPKPKRLLPLLGLFITLIIIAGLGGIKETSAAEFPPLSTPPDAITWKVLLQILSEILWEPGLGIQVLSHGPQLQIV